MSAKDVIENQHLSLLTHDGKLQSTCWIFFQTKKDGSLQPSLLQSAQPHMQVFKRRKAFHFN
jgi:hypothetical protein